MHYLTIHSDKDVEQWLLTLGDETPNSAKDEKIIETQRNGQG